MFLVTAAAIYLAGGYLSACHVWDEDVLARLAGKNYVDQNLILLMGLHFVGAAVTFITWPLATPAILVWRWANK